MGGFFVALIKQPRNGSCEIVGETIEVSRVLRIQPVLPVYFLLTGQHQFWLADKDGGKVAPPGVL